MRLRRPALALLCLALALLAGCGKGKATVKGKITFNKTPLNAGSVSFLDESGRGGSGTIKSDGTYEVTNAPVGDVTITVTTPEMPRGPAIQMPKPPKGVGPMPKEMLPPGYEENKPMRVVPAPKKYATLQDSPEKYTVKPGAQEYDIDLKP